MIMNIKRGAIALIAPRKRRLAWCYLFLCLPILVLATFGYVYGGFVLYSVLAAVVIGQFFYPTLLGWGVTLLIYAIFSGLYFYLLVADIIALIAGRRPTAFVDPSDSTLFLILLFVAIGFLVLTYKIRPAPRSAPS